MKLTRFGVALGAVVFAVSALSGCSKVTDIRDAAAGAAEKVVSSGTEKITEAVSGNLFTAEGIDNAYAAISEKVGANPMQVVEVSIAPGVLSVEAIDPNAPTELNQWSYTSGAVAPSRPIDYDDDTEALQQNLFATSDVPSSAIAAAIDGAVAASEIPDGKVQTVSIKRNIPFDENVIIFINVQGERSSKQVRADVTGQVTDVA
ncbi:hypothetical protein ACT17_00385 [Mycolicibacterium conceptionense]|jgi:hypothetical protein|uniref:Uncharacterized protein n=3 Tax=Mycolicibacterium TaxID=1866885 RepID=A0A0J8UFG2_9MYCO|nr:MULTISPECIES: hypothetical protein [Mycolicibacterium]KLI07250.1 hypothetical protein AA982_15235 [Mycolicibacterium senegalense]KLO48659.1 hypothetical protein ABW05_28910 [Mycolicibacterium senegalense]KMV20193.1 hypothetical protein ACT17_00385 [Mycolicibacterium conceptionense]OBJ92418.1 hypothetical protein A5639_08030 [Mycolicibacterium conceptionense]OMB88831.1 hypothetical protein A5741_01260 [Mycolicibacterium conceptionense]